MPDYNQQIFDPPAPVANVANVANVTVRALDGIRHISDVAMLIDSGADLTLIPRACAERLGLDIVVHDGLRLQGFDGSVAMAEVVEK